MEIIKKYGLLLGLATVIVGAFSFFHHMYQRDITAMEDFVTTYEEFDKTISIFSKPVFASNLEGTAAVDQFNTIYKQIVASAQETRPHVDRLALAKEGIALNNYLLDELDKTDDLESKSMDVLAGLKTKSTLRISSLIKNDPQLMRTALEVADLSAKELDNLIALKRTIKHKRELTKGLLQNIIDDDGGLDGFIKILNQKEYQARTLYQNTDLERLSKYSNDLTNKRITVYTNFQRLEPTPEASHK